MAAATAYTLIGPGGCYVAAASRNFTVTINGDNVGVTITPSSNGAGGTFTPSTVVCTTGAPAQTFTYTPVITGNILISTSDDAALTDPSPISFVSFGLGERPPRRSNPRVRVRLNISPKNPKRVRLRTA